MQTSETTRLDYLDHLKTALTMLVVVHHAGQPYGGSNGWWYFEHSGEALNLGAFFGVNASFFMSLFFFISAYFMPASYDKKGAKRYLNDRLGRLGTPLFCGFFLLMPAMMYTYYLHFRGYPQIPFGEYYAQIYLGIGEKPSDWTGPSWPDLQFGHLWFIEHLLIYSVLYAVYRKFRKNPQVSMGVRQFPRMQDMLLYIAFVSAATFFIRIWHPIDQWMGLVGFIQIELAHFPQYASFLVAGMLASSRGWLTHLSDQQGKVWLGIGVLLAVLRYMGLVPFAGGGLTWVSLLFSLYETATATGLVVGLLYVFRRYFNVMTKTGKMLAANAYAVYIIHVPVLVTLQYAFAGLQLPVMVTFLLVSFFGITISFLLSYWIRKVSYVRRIL